MTAIRRFTQRLLAVFRASRAEDELAREIDAHLRLLEDGFVSNGMSREEARFAARRAFGGVEQAKEHQRNARSFRWLDDSRIDFKLGARMLAKYPGLSIIGGAGLAVGIAISTGFFAFFYAYLASELPIDEGHRVVALENWDLRINDESQQQTHDFVTWRDEMRSVEDVSAFRTVGRNLIVPGRAVEPVEVAEMSPSGFRLTRVPPLLGRTLIESDAEAGARPVVVIGHDVWQSRFAADPTTIGREVRLGSVFYTVVGVMPEGYRFPVSHSYWIPFRPEPERFARGQGPAIFVFARLAQGETIETAQAELSTIGARTAAAFPDTHAQLSPRIMAYAYPILDIQGVMVWQVALFQVAMSLLLVVVAVNVGVLNYARTATRHGELALRTALGASRRRIVGQLFIEALVLSAVGAAGGLLLMRFGLGQAHAIMEAEFGGPLPYWIDISLPPVVLVYVLGLALLSAIVAGVVPALHATGPHMQSSLRELGGVTRARLGKTWTTLIVAQVAIAVVVLPFAVQFGWHPISTGSTRPAFESEPYLAAFVSPDPDPLPGLNADTAAREQQLRFNRLRSDLVAALEAEPEVDDVTMASAAPGRERAARMELEGGANDATDGIGVRTSQIAPDYFDALGGRILAGRNLTAADVRAAERPVVVNRAFVEQVLDGGAAVGRRVRYATTKSADTGTVSAQPWHEIVGVASDLHTNPINPALVNPTVFHPLPDGASRTAFLIRVRGGSGAAFAARARELAIGLDPTIRIDTLTLADLERQTAIATRLALFAAVMVIVAVILLSAAGIYALMSFTVTQRRKEIGIRTAMGASASQLLRGVFARAAAQLTAGVMVGLVLALAIDRASGGEYLGQVGRLALPVVSLVMVIVGMLAAVGPARSGMRIQPTQALRED